MPPLIRNYVTWGELGTFTFVFATTDEVGQSARRLSNIEPSTIALPFGVA